MKEYEVLKNARILYVEDEEDVLKFTSMVLEDYTGELYIAKNGEEALEILAHQKIDLLITDILMPRVSGIELIKEMRQRYGRASPPSSPPRTPRPTISLKRLTWGWMDMCSSLLMSKICLGLWRRLSSPKCKLTSLPQKISLLMPSPSLLVVKRLRSSNIFWITAIKTMSFMAPMRISSPHSMSANPRW